MAYETIKDELSESTEMYSSYDLLKEDKEISINYFGAYLKFAGEFSEPTEMYSSYDSKLDLFKEDKELNDFELYKEYSEFKVPKKDEYVPQPEEDKPWDPWKPGN
jgi:hypothetical protein